MSPFDFILVQCCLLHDASLMATAPSNIHSRQYDWASIGKSLLAQTRLLLAGP